jgi:hypothetical protein
VRRSRSTVATVTEAADALLEWPQTQSSPAGSRPSPLDPVAAAPSAVAPDVPAGVRSSGDLEAEESARADEEPGAMPVASTQDSPEPGDGTCRKLV